LTIHWHETAGPEARKPSVTGFGTKIITGSIERQLGGKVRFDWASAGLRCTLTVPRGERLDAALPPASDVRPAGPVARPIAARRVMIVEDEALVALVLADHLTEFGLSVVGPCASVAEATAALEANDLDAAILDVNLGKELVYPVAELLADRGIPFVFVTGYGPESIDNRFAHAAVLEKPVERDFLRNIFGSGPGSILEHGMARTA
jgi:CheY-like chemotaxis protein